LDDIFTQSRIISLHAAKTLATDPLMGASLLAKIRNDALLIHTTRASIIDLPQMGGPTIVRWEIVTQALIDDVLSILDGGSPRLGIDRTYAMAMTPIRVYSSV